ncbi:MAG: hypothetical protein K0Q73_8570 [Paenibacillus sp.]|nr:hypothetical protein [Paenibacillus sp.]
MASMEGCETMTEYKVRSIKFLLIGVIVCLLCSCSKSDEQRDQRHDNILINYDLTDFKRIEKFVSRFKEGKGDYLLVIPPIIDGGYWIYDIHSDGTKIDISIDASRDFYSDQSVSKYSCKGITINDEKFEGKTRRVVTANNCDGKEQIDKLGLFVLQDPRDM